MSHGYPSVIAILGGLTIDLLLGLHHLSGEITEPHPVALCSIPKAMLDPVILLAFGLGYRFRVASQSPSRSRTRNSPGKAATHLDAGPFPTEDVVRKLKVADEACESRDFLIATRTAARTGLGLDGALRRVEAAAGAGADIIVVESLESEEGMARICAAVDKPLITSLATGDRTPILPRSIRATHSFG